MGNDGLYETGENRSKNHGEFSPRYPSGDEKEGDMPVTVRPREIDSFAEIPDGEASRIRLQG